MVVDVEGEMFVTCEPDIVVNSHLVRWWLVTKTRPQYLNAVQAIARYS